MNEYTASNGLNLWQGCVGWERTRLSFGETEALREFFRAEEDERLGRWRSLKNPAWTAVKQAGSGQVFFRHDGGEREFSVASRGERLDRWDYELREVAFEFFDAHPEPKPWHDAKPGEVWVLTVVTGPTFDEVAMRVLSGSDGPRFFPIAEEDGMTYGRRSNEITAGRRIYPEPS